MSYYRRVSLGSDPELVILDSNNEARAASDVLDTYFDKNDIRLGDEFLINGFSYKRSKKKTRVGDVHYIVHEGDDKHDPVKHLKDVPGPNLVVDGISLEINQTPFTCRNHIISNLGVAINSIQHIIDDLDEDLKVGFLPVVELTDEVLDSLPEQAKVFGCDPDMDIYNMATTSIQRDASEHKYRYFGGHIHLSFGKISDGPRYTPPVYTSDIFSTKESTAKWFADNMYNIATVLDRTVGLVSVALSNDRLESIRRIMYGQAGRVRVQPHGIEYRTPSNFWLVNPSVTSYIMLWSQMASNIILDNNLSEELAKLYDIMDVVKVINTGNADIAIEMINITWDLLKEIPGLSQPSDSNYTLDYHQDNNTIEFANNIYNSGGVLKVFPEDKIMDSWSADGFYPSYEGLETVSSFSQRGGIH